MKVAWEIEQPAFTVLNNQVKPMAVSSTALGQENRIGAVLPNNPSIVRPLPPVLSIDLIGEASGDLRCDMILIFPLPQKCPSAKQLSFHIRNVSLNEKGNSGSIEWQIPASISEGASYKIRISGGKFSGDIKCIKAPCVLPEPTGWNVFDESDKVFSIKGGPLPTISTSPVPQPTPVVSVERIEALKKEITQMILRLQELLKQLETTRNQQQ